MKKILSLGIAVLLLAACSNDDDKKTSAVNIDELAKKWYNVSTKIGNGQAAPYEHEPCSKDYLEFTANSTVVKDFDYFDCQLDPTISTGVYSVNDETLTTTINNETVVYTIKKLNSSTLHLESTFNGNTILEIYTSNP